VFVSGRKRMRANPW